MNVVAVIVFIISLIIGVKIVNSMYQMYMKMIGADYMSFNTGKKVVAIFIVTMFVMGGIIKFLSVFGIVFE